MSKASSSKKSALGRLKAARDRFFRNFATQLGWDGKVIGKADEIVATRLQRKRGGVANVRLAKNHFGSGAVQLVRQILGDKAEFLDPSILQNPKPAKRSKKTKIVETGVRITENSTSAASEVSAHSKRRAPVPRNSAANRPLKSLKPMPDQNGKSRTTFAVRSIVDNGEECHAIVFDLNRKFEISFQGRDILVRIKPLGS